MNDSRAAACVKQHGVTPRPATQDLTQHTCMQHLRGTCIQHLRGRWSDCRLSQTRSWGLFGAPPSICYDTMFNCQPSQPYQMTIGMHCCWQVLLDTVQISVRWSAHEHFTSCSCVKAVSGRSAARRSGVSGRCALSCRRLVNVRRAACAAVEQCCRAVARRECCAI